MDPLEPFKRLPISNSRPDSDRKNEEFQNLVDTHLQPSHLSLSPSIENQRVSYRPTPSNHSKIDEISLGLQGLNLAIKETEHDAVMQQISRDLQGGLTVLCAFPNQPLEALSSAESVLSGLTSLFCSNGSDEVTAQQQAWTALGLMRSSLFAQALRVARGYLPDAMGWEVSSPRLFVIPGQTGLCYAIQWEFISILHSPSPVEGSKMHMACSWAFQIPFHAETDFVPEDWQRVAGRLLLHQKNATDFEPTVQEYSVPAGEGPLVSLVLQALSHRENREPLLKSFMRAHAEGMSSAASEQSSSDFPLFVCDTWVIAEGLVTSTSRGPSGALRSQEAIEQQVLRDWKGGVKIFLDDESLGDPHRMTSAGARDAIHCFHNAMRQALQRAPNSSPKKVEETARWMLGLVCQGIAATPGEWLRLAIAPLSLRSLPNTWGGTFSLNAGVLTGSVQWGVEAWDEDHLISHKFIITLAFTLDLGSWESWSDSEEPYFPEIPAYLSWQLQDQTGESL